MQVFWILVVYQKLHSCFPYLVNCECVVRRLRPLLWRVIFNDGALGDVSRGSL